MHALAVDKSDVLYAATSPQGKIYRITGEAKGEVFYQPEDRYIWALAVSPKGELYAATGERGIVYRIPAKGKADVVFRSEEFHVVTLSFDAAGNLVAGTDGKGLLYRIAPDGRATVLYDSPLREVNAVVIDPKGVIYAAAVGQEGEIPSSLPAPPQQAPERETPPPGRGPLSSVVIPGVESGTTTTVTVTASATAPGPGSGAAPKSEVYRIDTDGTVTPIWSSQSEVVYSLALDPSGRPVAGTGEPGRIRILGGSLQSTLLARLPESQVTSLIAGQGQQSGTYLSPTCDAQTVSRWGRISWRATIPNGTKIEVSTRSGNSAVPDTTWSDWTAAYGSPDGSAVSSPSARFLQWRARLLRPAGGTGPTLSAVSVAYLPSNLPPALRRIQIEPPGVVRERLPYAVETDPQDLALTGIRVNPDGGPLTSRSPALPDKKVYVRGMRAIDWDADDPNGDTLSFDLSFKGEGESAARQLFLVRLGAAPRRSVPRARGGVRRPVQPVGAGAQREPGERPDAGRQHAARRAGERPQERQGRDDRGQRHGHRGADRARRVLPRCRALHSDCTDRRSLRFARRDVQHRPGIAAPRGAHRDRQGDRSPRQHRGREGDLHLGLGGRPGKSSGRIDATAGLPPSLDGTRRPSPHRARLRPPGNRGASGLRHLFLRGRSIHLPAAQRAGDAQLRRGLRPDERHGVAPGR